MRLNDGARKVAKLTLFDIWIEPAFFREKIDSFVATLRNFF